MNKNVKPEDFDVQEKKSKKIKKSYQETNIFLHYNTCTDMSIPVIHNHVLAFIIRQLIQCQKQPTVKSQIQ